MSELAASWWRNRAVFLTGATGFIGRHLVAELEQLGARVSRLAACAEPKNSAGPLDDLPALEVACANADLVIHLAAASVRAAATPQQLSRTNIEGTWNVLEAARRSPRGPFVLIASTDRVYSNCAELPRNEAGEVAPRGGYAISKACAELVAAAAFREGNVRGAVLRLANVYGPNDAHGTRLVPSIMNDIAEGRTPRLRGDGLPKRDFVFVADVVAAFLAVARWGDQPENSGEVFNVGSGVGISTLELAQLALRVAGRPDVTVERDCLDHAADGDSWLDCRKIERAVGWRPRMSLDEGLRLTWKARLKAGG